MVTTMMATMGMRPPVQLGAGLVFGLLSFQPLVCLSAAYPATIIISLIAVRNFHNGGQDCHQHQHHGDESGEDLGGHQLQERLAKLLRSRWWSFFLLNFVHWLKPVLGEGGLI